MSAIFQKAVLSIRNTVTDTCPFIWPIVPFVGCNSTFIRPFVSRNQPFVRTTLGFTLIELVITLIIAGILSMIAAPSISRFVHSNRLTTSTNEIIADFNLARSEAIKRRANIIVCKSDDMATCTSSGTWESGWVVFVDADGDGGWSGGDTLLKVHEGLPDNSSITMTTSADIVTYTAQGTLPAGSAAFTNTLCNSKINQTRAISVEPTGRPGFTQGGC